MTDEERVGMQDVEAARSIADPAERITIIKDLHATAVQVEAAIRELRMATVRELREAGWSHGEIGKALGTHRNRAQQIAKGLSGGRDPQLRARSKDAAE